MTDQEAPPPPSEAPPPSTQPGSRLGFNTLEIGFLDAGAEIERAHEAEALAALDEDTGVWRLTAPAGPTQRWLVVGAIGAVVLAFVLMSFRKTGSAAAVAAPAASPVTAPALPHAMAPAANATTVAVASKSSSAVKSAPATHAHLAAAVAHAKPTHVGVHAAASRRSLKPTLATAPKAPARSWDVGSP